MLRTVYLLHPASTQTSRSKPGASLPGTLASPRTGLTPAGSHELFARLRHGVVSFLTASELLDAHQRLWEAMDAISEEQLGEIERRIVAQMVETFEVDLSGLVPDMTNFATWIDSGNPRVPIAQRGHSKQKRNDLASVGSASWCRSTVVWPSSTTLGRTPTTTT